MISLAAAPEPLSCPQEEFVSQSKQLACQARAPAPNGLEQVLCKEGSGPTGAWKPGREVDLGWTFKRDVWEGEIRLASAGRAQDHLLRPRETQPHIAALAPGGGQPESSAATLSEAVTLSEAGSFHILSPHL